MVCIYINVPFVMRIPSVGVLTRCCVLLLLCRWQDCIYMYTYICMYCSCIYIYHFLHANSMHTYRFPL